MKKANGYFEGNGYILTWVFGHLFSLADIDDYSPNPDGTKRWTLKNIPCFPDSFKFELKKDPQTKRTDTGVVRQFELIKALVNREDVDTVINAGDADREGEIIVRICVKNALHTPKEFKRLWLPDQTPRTIRAALSDMKDEAEYENLANEGYARTYIDWLYGVNLTRLATLKTGKLLRVGRVIVPIVKAIYDRDMAIRNFKPEIYYAIVSKAQTKGEEIELTSKEKFDKTQLNKAQELCNKYNSAKASVISKKKKKETIQPGKLYSLTKLQNVLGKKYKMSMQESLKIVQDLYEKGYVTYPRTNSEYLATAEQDKVKAILKSVAALGYPVEFKFKKSIFDDSKIESHSALTPTYKIPDKTKLTPQEFTVYSTIMRRFVAVFCSEECIAEKTEIKIDVGGYEEFTLKGTVMKQAGWTKYDDYNKKDKILPNLEKGEEINIDFKPTEKETTPPKHYTIETLNNYLKNPFREDKAKAQEAKNGEEETDDEEYKAIFEGLELGTEATRTGIIDNAKKSGYIELKKDVYTILPGGEQLIEALQRMSISMDKYKTAEVGKALKKVFHGEFTIDDSIAIAKNEIAEVFNKQKEVNDGFFGDIIGKCPLCGEPIKKWSNNYGCSGYKNGCSFSVSANICGKQITIKEVTQLIETGRTDKLNGFVSPKKGTQFSARLKLENGKAVFDFTD